MRQTTSNDGTIIGYKQSGAGPFLLLVHGTTADHSRWASILPRFEEQFSVVVMDRRGRGASTDGPAYDLLREAEDVAAVVEAIGEQVSVLGHSYGALCSLEAGLLTNRIERLILYEPPVPTGLPMYPPNVPDEMQGLINAGALESALELFMRQVVGMPEQALAGYRQLPAWPVRIALAPTIPRELAIDRMYQFVPDKFANFDVPTLLMLGEKSPPLFQQAIEVLAAALPNSTAVILPDQQHIAMDTNPDLFVGEVLNFLQA